MDSLAQASSKWPDLEMLSKDKMDGANSASARAHPDELVMAWPWVPVPSVCVIDRPNVKVGVRVRRHEPVLARPVRTRIIL